MNHVLLWHRLCLNSCLLLILTLLTGQLLLDGNPVTAIIYSLPLFLIVYALIRKRIRMLQWLGFVLMLYFLNCVLSIFSPGRLYEGLITTILCVITFTSAMLFINITRKASTSPVKESTS